VDCDKLMIKCWNEQFETVEQLWEHPRCYAPTVAALRHRLRTCPPEQAVLPEYVEFMGKRYDSIYRLYFELGDILSRSALYYRLGLIHKGRKLTVEQATRPRSWDSYKKLQRTGTFGTILI
jgi:hypothetical protein